MACLVSPLSANTRNVLPSECHQERQPQRLGDMYVCRCRRVADQRIRGKGLTRRGIREEGGAIEALEEGFGRSTLGTDVAVGQGGEARQ